MRGGRGDREGKLITSSARKCNLGEVSEGPGGLTYWITAQQHRPQAGRG